MRCCPSHSSCCWLLSLAFVCLLQLPRPGSAAAGKRNHSGVVADAELSASERNRRLIPYMAFYLPAPELPINQQYAVKHSPAAGGPQLLAPEGAATGGPEGGAPNRIPVPVAYMPQPHPQQQQQQQQQQHYRSHAGDVYHALAMPHRPLPPLAPVRGKELPAPGATFIAYKPLSSSQKHKTVQHFPPLPLPMPQQELPQPPHRQQPLDLFHQRQRSKQSKVNLTPFTPQNTLPGHFVPIIYTPLSKPNDNSGNKNGDGNDNDDNNELRIGNAINYNKKQQQQPAEIVYHKNEHQTQIVTDYAGDVRALTGVSASPESQMQEEQALEEAGQPKASIGYAGTASSTPTQSTKNAVVVHQKSPSYGHVSKYESYFSLSPDQQLHPQLTPQEKYVLYLQQRMKQQRQHQDRLHPHHHHHHHPQHQHQHQVQQEQPAQSNTKTGKHPHSHLHAAPPSPAPPATPPPPPPQQAQSHHSQIHNYNGLFARPGLDAQQEQREQQVLHIPLRALMGPLHEQPKDSLLGSAAPPNLIEYLIDGPRQSLDEEHHEQPRPPPSSPRPHHAYILVTTPTPYVDESPPPTRTPLVYKQQPTLRLQPVTPAHKYHATRRPVYVGPSTPSDTVKITPKYVYVSSKPPAAVHREQEPQAPPPPVKLKPIHKYVHERPAATSSQVLAPTDEDQLPDIRTSSLTEILHKLQASNHLPHTLTPDNIDNSIKTLIRILQNLKQTQTILANPPQHHEAKQTSPSSSEYEYDTGSGEEPHTQTKVAGHVDADLLHLKGPNKHPGPSTGRAGIDYPNYAEIPKTSFECTQQRYKGFFGDPETNCQVWHYCDLNGGKASFLCPNGTIFSQIALTCDWWFNVKCSTTSQLYVLNERLYKYILPFNPKFPEDYNGPIVDKYLAMKFQEMEEKMRLEKQRKASQQAEKPTVRDDASTPALPKNHKPSPKHGSGINAQVYEQSSERNLLIDDEIDDISERGTFDTYGQAAPTTNLAPTTATSTTVVEESHTLGLRPIVVSSTPEPDFSAELESQPASGGIDPQLEAVPVLEADSPESSQGTNVEEDKLQILRDTNVAAGQKQLETTKVSVEKLEVIEIKPDGTTGHLMPVLNEKQART